VTEAEGGGEGDKGSEPKQAQGERERESQVRGGVSFYRLVGQERRSGRIEARALDAGRGCGMWRTGEE